MLSVGGIKLERRVRWGILVNGQFGSFFVYVFRVISMSAFPKVESDQLLEWPSSRAVKGKCWGLEGDSAGLHLCSLVLSVVNLL